MSGAWTIAAMTAALKGFLENELGGQTQLAGLDGEVSVSALPLDRISTGGEERAQLNLFLWQVTPHTRLPTASRAVAEPYTPMFELHYLLSAFGRHDLEAELLLGFAISRLQLLAQEPKRRSQALAAVAAGNGRHGAALAAGMAIIAESADLVQIEPVYLAMEEMARVWSAAQARYRPSVAYRISPVALVASTGQTPKVIT